MVGLEVKNKNLYIVVSIVEIKLIWFVFFSLWLNEFVKDFVVVFVIKNVISFIV